jgi:hypothetical protein
MIDIQSYTKVKREILERTKADKVLLEQLREEIRPLKPNVRRIQPRSTTAISLVATDGGNNKFQFDPFLIQLVRVVDSSSNELSLEAISTSTDVKALSERQLEQGTPLGKMMVFLGVQTLNELSTQIPKTNDEARRQSGWVQVYRQLVEWAVLFEVAQKDYGTDTLLIFDGLLKSKVFAGNLFAKYGESLWEILQRQKREKRRNLYVAGVAKTSKVLDRYRLAMALENILTTPYPAYVEIPMKLEAKAYDWDEYALRDDLFVNGQMYFAKFGSRPRDPVWLIDVFSYQKAEAAAIIGCMLADAQEGFPIPFYPRCLQKAHEHAALVDFDFDVLQGQIFEAMRDMLGKDSHLLDVFLLQDDNPARLRYGVE